MNASEGGRAGWTVPGFSTLGELGVGATGRVVIAVEDATGRRVAIKYLVPHLAGDQTFVARFRAGCTSTSRPKGPQRSSWSSSTGPR
jgi:serine/threonine-protein kinase